MSEHHPTSRSCKFILNLKDNKLVQQPRTEWKVAPSPQQYRRHHSCQPAARAKEDNSLNQKIK